ncbi:MAG: hypothetical protein ACRC6I_01065 [Paracoccaceae bacterium]
MHDLVTTLDAVHAALLDGDINQIAPLTRRVEVLMTNPETPSEAELTIIRAKAMRNARTLEAAMQGLRAASRRLAELREAASGHKTYGRDGRRAIVATLATNLRQRI